MPAISYVDTAWVLDELKMCTGKFKLHLYHKSLVQCVKVMIGVCHKTGSSCVGSARRNKLKDIILQLHPLPAATTLYYSSSPLPSTQ